MEEEKKESSGTNGSQKSIASQIREFIRQLTDIKRNTDEEGSIQSIKDGIPMKGHTAWILVFSILIASVGLNTNSTAVVIGAMLISPLMGPLLGIGLAIGTNDMSTLRRSGVNLLVMVGLSVLTSFLYFSIPLVQDSTSELLARTRPDIRDVFIALAGGAALIVAITRPRPQTNTVAGVAIATALMPPLCTAGYGLALGSSKYFFGAMFLFTINGIFIAVSTYLIVKFLGFRTISYMDPSKKKRITRITSLVAIVIIGMSIFSFYQLMVENQFNQKCSQFLSELRNEDIAILSDDDECIDFDNRTITVPVLGREISDDIIAKWNARLKEMGLEGVDLIVQQEDNSELRKQVNNLQDLYSQNQKLITSRDETIREKEEKIDLLETELNRLYGSQVPFQDLSQEVKLLYTEINSISFSQKIFTDFNRNDTLLLFEIEWDEALESADWKALGDRIEKWLKRKLNTEKVRVESVVFE